MFDLERALKLFDENQFNPVGEIPLEDRRLIFTTIMKALVEYIRLLDENPLSLKLDPCIILGDVDLFSELVESPCTDAGLYMGDVFTVLQFICGYEHHHHFEDKRRLWLAMRGFQDGAKRRTKKASNAAVSRWEGVNELMESVRAEYIRDKAEYRSKADFVEVRYSGLVNTHGKQRPEEGDEIGLMPTRKQFYDEWLKGL